MRKRSVILAILLVVLWSVILIPRLNKNLFSFRKQDPSKILCVDNSKIEASLNEGFNLLKARKDKEALQIFEMIAIERPDNLDIHWARAEILRRERKYPQAESILKKNLAQDPDHAPSLVTLAYIKFKTGQLDESLKLINRAFKVPCLDKENQALAYIVLGAINGQRSKQGGFLDKIKYGTQIKTCFEKAKKLAPDFPDGYVGLGTYYLKAPMIAGGSLEKAKKELEYALKIAPDFATANARMAQVYKKSGDLEKYRDYLKKTQALDPENEVLKEEEI